jgi:hypothetical protein
MISLNIVCSHAIFSTGRERAWGSSGQRGVARPPGFESRVRRPVSPGAVPLSGIFPAAVVASVACAFNV